MKDYRKLLETYDIRHTVFIQHEWGQNKNALYNLLAKQWNQIKVNDKVVITSYKHFGAKHLVTFLQKQGIDCSMVGKGPNNLRLIECQKTTDNTLLASSSKNSIKFDFRGREYRVNVGDAIFSKTMLDDGTRFLLETIFEKKFDFKNKKIGDFGSGWGAISLVLATEFPQATIVALEKDDASFEAAKDNLESFSNITLVHGDVTDTELLVTLTKHRNLDYILSNPPFHSTSREKELFFKSASSLLKSDGELLFVTENSFAVRFRKAIGNFFAILEETGNNTYTVFWCRKKSVQDITE